MIIYINFVYKHYRCIHIVDHYTTLHHNGDSLISLFSFDLTVLRTSDDALYIFIYS